MADITSYIGECIGDYELLEIIGDGETGAVFLAEHQAAGCQVAIKIFRTPVDEDAAWPEPRMERIRSLNGVEHPGINRVLDLGYQGGLGAYAILEPLAGATLEEQIKGGAYREPETAVRLLVQLASALQAAHDAGVKHLRLTPSRVICLDDPEVEGGVVCVVLGLGLEPPGDGDGAGSGALVHLAPEQLTGDAEAGRPADIYALGIIACQVLSGAAPFAAETAETKEELLDQLKQPPDLSKISPGLAGAIQRALKPEPGDRFETMEEMAAALDLAPLVKISGPPPDRATRIMDDDDPPASAEDADPGLMFPDIALPPDLDGPPPDRATRIFDDDHEPEPAGPPPDRATRIFDDDDHDPEPEPEIAPLPVSPLRDQATRIIEDSSDTGQGPQPVGPPPDQTTRILDDDLEAELQPPDVQKKPVAPQAGGALADQPTQILDDQPGISSGPEPVGPPPDQSTLILDDALAASVYTGADEEPSSSAARPERSTGKLAAVSEPAPRAGSPAWMIGAAAGVLLLGVLAYLFWSGGPTPPAGQGAPPDPVQPPAGALPAHMQPPPPDLPPPAPDLAPDLTPDAGADALVPDLKKIKPKAAKKRPRKARRPRPSKRRAPPVDDL